MDVRGRRGLWILYAYLTVYVLILLGALLSLWRGGVLAVIPPFWLIVGLAIAVAFGTLLLLTSLPPRQS